MGLLSFLQRKRPDAPARSAAPADVVAQARTKARRRLIGAVVLLGIGIIGFPLLFETQPRPIPVDIPIEIPRKDAVPQLAMPAPRPAAVQQAAPVVPPAASHPQPEMITEAAESPAPAVPASTARKSEPAPPVKEAAKEPPAPPAKESAPPKPAAADDGRFVVQVGAFAEVVAAREARGKVGKLGLKTYTQVVETSGGKRIRVRVGPFASRDQAAQAAEKIKAAGLPAAVLTL